ncbi:MAG: shikimate kinase [Bacteroidales bacterium]|nr:shikimate kinase [Bacteroidales bacterium]MDD3906848.1 shikimate kinase [Bacteroidales bacterium]MDD4711764.1 shikimate kinase [Bacteroidales bacterium]
MRRIFFIGYMGSGKTTFGRLIAKSQKLLFVDLDEYIEKKYSKSIVTLFDEFGESQFRQIERDALHEVAQLENCLIATGGGTPCYFDNMEYMNSVGDTVYLRTTVHELFDRLKLSCNKRPLLSQKSDQELESHIAEMLGKRKVCYMRSKYILDTDDLNLENLDSRFLAVFEV